MNYSDVIEWIPRRKGGRVTFYDQKKNLVKNSDGQIFKGDFIHIIPEQKAANIFYDSGLLNEGKDWCKINPLSFEVHTHNIIIILYLFIYLCSFFTTVLHYIELILTTKKMDYLV